MELKINLPFSLWDYRLSGVYRISFEDGTFYIGCSSHLRSRASAWSSIMRTGKGKPGVDIGTRVIAKIKELSSASFDIIEMCSPQDLKDKEAFYLSEQKDNHLMLSSWETGAWVPILQYGKSGNFIKKHMSISGAARFNNAKLKNIQRVLSGERKYFNDSVFIYEHDYDNRRKSIVKSRSKRVAEKKNGRYIVMMNESGDEIKRFKKITEAAKEVGCGSANISRVLSGYQKRAKGVVFKYA